MLKVHATLTGPKKPDSHLLTSGHRVEIKAASPSSTRLIQAALILIYAFALQASYIFLFQPLFSYERSVYQLHLENWPLTLVTIAVCLSPLTLLSVSISRPSDAAVWMFILIAAVPTASIAPIATGLTRYDSTNMSFAVTAAVFVVLIICRLGDLASAPTPLRPSESLFVWLLLGVSVLNTAYMVSTVGFTFRLDAFFGDAHSGRIEILDGFSAGGYAGYVLGWQSRAIGPILLILSVMRRKPAVFTVAVAIQLYMFSVTTQRSALVSLLLISVMAYIARPGKVHNFGTVLTAVFLSNVIILGILDFSGYGSVLNSLAVRRPIVLTGIITGNYFDLFGQYLPFANYGGSILSLGADQVYDQSIQRVLGEALYQRGSIHANGNFVATGYGNWGFRGVIVESCVAGLALAAYDVCSRGLDFRLRVLMLVVPAWTLSESSALISAFTHGLLLAALLAWITPRSFGEPVAQAAS